MRKQFLVGGLLTLNAVGCGSDSVVSVDRDIENSSAAIIGGSAAAESDFLAVVSLGGCSGILVHPLLVVYAEHCGTAIDEVRFGARAHRPERVVGTDRCRGFPGAKLGDGTDLAYCVLAQAVLDIQPERILAGCEVDDLVVGQPAIVVGFGIDEEGGTYGRKRVATTSVLAIGDELLMAEGDVDTCRGDSGGPVFIERQDDHGRVQRRVVGVTSAGSEAECGHGIGHYVNLIRKVDWLEEHSQLDLTPCFDQGEWSPTPRCTATQNLAPSAPHDAGVPDAGESANEVPLLESCGAAFDEAADERSPTIEWVSPTFDNAASTGKRNRRVHLELPDGGAYVEFELAVHATDRGWGVEQVLFSLFGDADELLFQRVDEFAPYGLPILRVPPGRFTLRAEARDFTGNTASTERDLQVGALVEPEVEPAGTSCSASRASSGGLWQALALALAIACALRRAVHVERIPFPRERSGD